MNGFGFGFSAALGTLLNQIKYLLQDTFTTAEAAAIATPRTCEPTGSTVITTPANLSIASGKLVAGGSFKMRSDVKYTRDGGLAIYFRNKLTNDNVDGARVGFSSNGTAILSGFVNTSRTVNIAAIDSTLFYNQIQPPSVFATYSDILIVLRPTSGFYVFHRSSSIGKWFLVYVTNVGTTAEVYAYVEGIAASVGNFDDLSVIKLGDIFNTDFGCATYHSATPVSPILQTGELYGTVEITWTPQVNEVLELYARQIDASNGIIVRCNQATSTFKLIQKVAGTETELQSVAQTWTVGTAFNIKLISHELAIRTYINDTIKHAKNIVTTLYMGNKWGASGFTTAANFVYWGGYKNLIKPFDFTGFRKLFFIGDSKTAARKTQAYLLDRLETSVGTRFIYEQSACSGYKIADIRTNIDAFLAYYTDVPESVLINIGSNDMTSPPTEANFKTYYRYIISAIHTKWSAAQIYLAKPVYLSGAPPNTPLANCATVHGWIDTIIAEQAYTHLGLVETDLENGTSYATYLADATHPNNAGYSKCAELWQAKLGL